MSGDTLSAQAELVRRRAADLAGELSRPARRSTTIAQERAILRMLGVDGLDRAGRPLAASLAERYCGSDRVRLSRGVILPFVTALLEYDMSAREVALDVAAGRIDLGLEAQLLERPERLAATEKQARALIDAALVRFDANRTATREMRDVLGLAGEPWCGLSLRSMGVEEAVVETKSMIGKGADVVLVSVPASWEFAEARRHAGIEDDGPFEFDGGSLVRGKPAPPVEAPARKAATRGRAAAKPARGRRNQSESVRPPAELIPAGSQRGLAELRKAADDASAHRGCYASLMTVTSAFAAPEQAVVAAFERVDFVMADPLREIVEDNVDPERALADHAFANRLQHRAGSRVVMAAGPLALGADVALGRPADAATQSGRGLALQALGVELALADGLPADRLYLGAVPEWIAARDMAAAVLVESWLRSLVFAGHSLVVSGPAARAATPAGVASLIAALAGGPAALVLQPDAADGVGAVAAGLGAAAGSSRALRAALGGPPIRGDAAVLAERILKAASHALERLGSEGWESLLGPDANRGGTERLGGSAVVERADGPASGARLLKALP